MIVSILLLKEQEVRICVSENWQNQYRSVRFFAN